MAIKTCNELCVYESVARLNRESFIRVYLEVIELARILEITDDEMNAYKGSRKVEDSITKVIYEDMDNVMTEVLDRFVKENALFGKGDIENAKTNTTNT